MSQSMRRISILVLLAALALGVALSLRRSAPGDAAFPAPLEVIPSPSPTPQASPSPSPSPTPLAMLDDGSTVPLWMASVSAPHPGRHSYQFRIELEPVYDPANPVRRVNRLGQPEAILRYPRMPEDKSPDVSSDGRYLLFFWNGPLGLPALLIAPYRGGDWGADTFEPANGAARRVRNAWDGDPALGTLAGDVVDRAGKPVPHALVQAHELDPPWRLLRTVACGGDGLFRMDHLPVGSVRLRARAPGFAEYGGMPADVPSGVDPGRMHIVLAPGGRVRGRVVGDTGGGIAGAEVRSHRTNSPVWSDAEGGFLLDYLPPGTHHLTARAEGFGTGFAPGILVREGADTPDVTIALKPGMAVAGKVVQPTAGGDRPVADAVVAAWYRVDGAGAPDQRVAAMETRAVSDEKGAFSLADLPVGATVRIGAYKGFAETEKAITLALQPAAPPAPVELRLPEIVDVHGRVVGENDRPVTDARVEVQPFRRTDGLNMRHAPPILSDAQGRFIVAGLPARATVHLRASAAGYVSGEARNVVPGDQIEDVEIRLEVGGSISGRAVLVETSEPVPNVSLRLSGLRPEQSARTAADGAFRFDNLPDGRFTIDGEVMAQGEGGARLVVVPDRSLQIRDGEDRTDVEIRIAAGKRLAGRVVEQGAETPVSGAEVSVRGDGLSRSAVTDADGAFVFDALPPMEFRLVARKSGYGQTQESMSQVKLDDLVAVEPVVLQLTRGEGVIEGRVEDAAGAPVSGANVRVVSTRRGGGERMFFSNESVRSDEAGAFRIEGLPVGRTFRVFVSLDTPGIAGTGEDVALTAESPRASVVIRLAPRGALHGRVKDDAGQPVEGAAISCRLGDGNDDRQSRQFSFSTPGFKQAETDGRGEWRIEGLAAGKYTLSARADGYIAAEAIAVTVPAEDGETAAPDFVLKRGGKLRGIVVDLEAQPLAGWQVNAGGQSATTSYSGTFELAGLPDTFDLDFSTPRGERVRIVSSAMTPRAEETVFVLPLAPGVRGRVVDRDTGEPIPGVTVAITLESNDASAATGDPPCRLFSAQLRKSAGADGRFQIERVPVGAVRITVTGEAIAPFPYRATIQPEWTDLGDIAISRAVIFTARLTDDATGEPPRNLRSLRAYAQVAGNRINLSVTRPDADGVVRIGGAPVETASIEIGARGYLPAVIDRLPKIEPGKTIDLGDIRLSAGATLTGRIVDAETHRPVAVPRGFAVWVSRRSGASMRLPHINLGAQDAGQAGRFRLTAVPSDIVELQFLTEETCFHRIASPAYSASGETDLGDIPFSEGKELTGRLIDARTGAPPAAPGLFLGVISGLSVDDTPIYATAMLAPVNGRFSTAGFPEQARRVRLWVTGYLPRTVDAPARDADGACDLGDVTVQAGERITGSVVDAQTGMGFGEAVLFVVQPGVEFSHSIFPADTAQALRNLPANRYFQFADLHSSANDGKTASGDFTVAGLYPGNAQLRFCKMVGGTLQLIHEQSSEIRAGADNRVEIRVSAKP